MCVGGEGAGEGGEGWGGGRGEEGWGGGRGEEGWGGGILYKTKSTGSFLESIKTHYNPLHFSAHGKQLVCLVLTGIKRHVTNVESAAVSQLLFIILGRELKRQTLFNSLSLSPYLYETHASFVVSVLTEGLSATPFHASF